MQTTIEATRRYTITESPVGPLLLIGHDDAVSGVFVSDNRRAPVPGGDWRRDEGAFAGTVAQLAAYFAGELTTFDVKLAAAGTPFQQLVWRALVDIPFGETASYASVAVAIGRPGAARAVGHANARNPVSIIVPCHRVVGASGTLTGYAGGVDRKRLLLDHERAVLSA